MIGLDVFNEQNGNLISHSLLRSVPPTNEGPTAHLAQVAKMHCGAFMDLGKIGSWQGLKCTVGSF